MIPNVIAENKILAAVAVLIILVGLNYVRRRIQRKNSVTVQDDAGLSLTKLVDFATLEHELAAFDPETAPFSTGLFPSDLHLLWLHGYEVVQIVTGNVTYSMGFRGVTSSVVRAMKQGEMPAISRMLQDARLIARNRMDEQAKALGADGVIGVTFQNNDILDFLEVSAMGTAIKKIGEDMSSKESPTLDLAVS